MSAPLGQVVVFPFHSVGSSPRMFAERLTDGIFRSLEQNSKIDVVPAFELLPEEKSVQNHHLFPEEMRNSIYLEGSVQGSEENLRITVQIVDGPTETHLWSESYVTNVYELDDVSADIASQLISFVSR